MRYDTSERITVGVVYGDEGHIRPAWFLWEGKEHRVTSINHIWREKIGREALIFFSVSDKADTYLLCYHTIQLRWTLCGVAMEG
jgi:hypothetical protein